MNQSPTTRFCLRCNAYHPIHYTLDSAYKYHLLVECPRGEYPTPMVRGLPIKTVEARSLVKQKQKMKQRELF